jgi:hypothetical protein
MGCICQMQSMQDCTVLGCDTVSLSVACDLQGRAGGPRGLPIWVTWVYTGKTWPVRHWTEFRQACRKVWELSGLQMDKAVHMAVIGWALEGWSLIGSEQASWWVQDHRVGNTLEERGDAVHREQPACLDCAQYRDHHHHHLLYSATQWCTLPYDLGAAFRAWSSVHPSPLAPAHSLTSFSMQQLSGQTLPTYPHCVTHYVRIHSYHDAASHPRKQESLVTPLW